MNYLTINNWEYSLNSLEYGCLMEYFKNHNCSNIIFNAAEKWFDEKGIDTLETVIDENGNIIYQNSEE